MPVARLAPVAPLPPAAPIPTTPPPPLPQRTAAGLNLLPVGGLPEIPACQPSLRAQAPDRSSNLGMVHAVRATHRPTSTLPSAPLLQKTRLSRVVRPQEARHPCAPAGGENPQSSGARYRLPENDAVTLTAPPYSKTPVGARGWQGDRPVRRQTQQLDAARDFLQSQAVKYKHEITDK